ncbi:hypothetical protein FXF59_35060 [Microbispora tritici]|uniref:Uncharacterized protein n=1 Tax=Microbispora tritici TaxID=2604471 RepID=A0ABY3LM70_9ACTN|nr:hypothetical protein FXF59_35060 [Microbispora tritici]
MTAVEQVQPEPGDGLRLPRLHQFLAGDGIGAAGERSDRDVERCLRLERVTLVDREIGDQDWLHPLQRAVI